MSTHSFPICCQFSLVRKIPFNIFCTAGLLAASSHLSESALSFPLSLRDKFEVDRVFVFSFLILYFEDVMSLSLVSDSPAVTRALFLRAQCTFLSALLSPLSLYCLLGSLATAVLGVAFLSRGFSVLLESI